MRFQLKRISVNERLSEETIAFAADVWWNGRKAGVARNSGQGGGTDVHLHLLKREERDAIDRWIAIQPPRVYPATEQSPSFSVPLSLDVIVDDLVDAHLQEKHGEAAQKRKWCKKNVVFRLRTDAPGQYRTLKKDNGVFTERQRAWLTRTYGDQLEEIVNDSVEGVNK